MQRPLFAAFAMALLASGCAKPQYWVEGLVLPPGATEVARRESRAKVPQSPEHPLQRRADNEHYLHVSFDSQLDWTGVIQHFEQCLSSIGYTETADTSLFGQTGRQPDYRYYTSPARKETVILHDHQLSRNQMAQVGLGRRDGPGRYELTVIERR